MKKQIGLFIVSMLVAFLGLLIAISGIQVQAQEGGRAATSSHRQNVGTAIITGVTPIQMAEAMGIPGSVVVASSYNGSDPLAFGVGDAPLGRYFPTMGETFAILSTGLAGNADAPNLEGNLSGFLGGLDNSQGNDMAQMALDLAIPPNVNCLGFDFAFYSEEFPEFVGSSFNDTFTAEIGGTNLTITTGVSGFPVVVAPWNFAFGAIGELMSVNTAFGVVSPTLSTYDGVSPLLRATTPVTPGTTTQVVFTIQDLGDSVWDSAVFIDNLFFSSDACQTGTGFTPTSGIISPDGGTLSYTNIQGQTTSLDFPPGAVPDNALITFTPYFSPTHPLSSGPGFGPDGQVKFAGYAFDVDGLLLPEKAYIPFIAKNSGAQQQAQTSGPQSTPSLATSQPAGGPFPLQQPVTIVIEYSDEELAERGIVDEMSLALWLYNEELQIWEDARNTCVPPVFTIDPVANTVTIQVCHFTEFGLVG